MFNKREIAGLKKIFRVSKVSEIDEIEQDLWRKLLDEAPKNIHSFAEIVKNFTGWTSRDAMEYAEVYFRIYKRTICKGTKR